MIYNHKLINDLRWAISSPSLLDNTPYDSKYLLSSDWGESQISDNLQLLTTEDKSPQRIQQYFSNKNGFRLGYYFEDLVAYWLEISPRYQLICKNLIVSGEKITLGELDFIIQDLYENKTIHLEVAVKFYLGTTHNKDKYWFGSNLRDRLDLKLDKLFNKQITFSDSTKVKELLASKNITIDEHAILLKGRLYDHSSNISQQPCWINASEFCKIKDESLWIKLNKTHWLAEQNNIEYNFLPSAVLNKNELNAYLSSEAFTQPVCMAKINNGSETNRIFITPDTWKENAISTLNGFNQ